MRWMKQDFQDKMAKYLGGGDWVPKRSRRDKEIIKEKLNFQPQ
jgi:hypothetical protein